MAYNSSNIHQWHFRHDALEALNSFAVARNLFFCVTIICLLVIQGVFISVDLGTIDSALDIPVCQSCDSADCESPQEQFFPADSGEAEVNFPENEPEIESQFEPGIKEIKCVPVYAGSFSFCLITDEFKSNPADSSPQAGSGIASDTISDQSQLSVPAEPSKSLVSENKPDLAAPKAGEVKEVVPDVGQSDDKEKESANALLVRRTLAGIVKAADIIIVFAIAMYGICLFVCIQMSLAGSLGGLASSTKAFFSAMLAILILLPWSRAFYPEAPSMLFSFNELITAYLAKSNGSDSYVSVLYYGRFCGLWLLILLLIVVSQWRSFSAARQISNRITEWKIINPFDTSSCVNVPVQPVAVSEPVKPDSHGPIPLE